MNEQLETTKRMDEFASRNHLVRVTRGGSDYEILGKIGGVKHTPWRGDRDFSRFFDHTNSWRLDSLRALPPSAVSSSQSHGACHHMRCGSCLLDMGGVSKSLNKAFPGYVAPAIFFFPQNGFFGAST